jgi:hypothetical protein
LTRRATGRRLRGRGAGRPGPAAACRGGVAVARRPVRSPDAGGGWGSSRSLPGTTPQSAYMLVRAISREMSDPRGSIGGARPRCQTTPLPPPASGSRECRPGRDGFPPHSASFPCLGRAPMPKIRSPHQLGLLALRHRLVADVTATNLARIAQVHAASLPRSVLLLVQAGSDKQETPSPARDEASTNAPRVLGVERGRYTECA